MRKEDYIFNQWVFASNMQLSAYEEDKNKAYTLSFLKNQNAFPVNIERKNHIILENDRFKNRQESALTSEEIDGLELKLEKIASHERMSNLIRYLKGEALQAPLNILEEIHFKQDREAISFSGKFNLGFYFYCEENLHSINLNFAYAIKNLSNNKNYILDEKSGNLMEISDDESQAFSVALNAVMTDFERYLSVPLNQAEKECKAEFSAERAARRVRQAFKSADTLSLKWIITLVEREIRPLIREYFFEHRAEYPALNRLLRLKWKALLGGGDHMALMPDWAHLEIHCPSDPYEFSARKADWQNSHEPGDVLIIRLPENQQWLGYKMDAYRNLELNRYKKNSPLAKALSDVTPQNVSQFDASIVRDLLPVQTRAVRQIELILGKNSDNIENTFSTEESPIRAILNLKKSLDLSEREKIVKHLFNKVLQQELKLASSIRDHVPEKSLRKNLKTLTQHFLNPYLSRDLNEGEFIRWVDASILQFFDNLKMKAASRNTRVREYYQAQSLPKIMAERVRQLARRKKWVQKILQLELSSIEIARFSRELVFQAGQIFIKSAGLYESMTQAFYALYSNTLHFALNNDMDQDNFIYRMVYMKSHDSANAPFLDILLNEAIHCKIMTENKWTAIEADIFRMKSAAYLARVHAILQEVTHKMEAQIQMQSEERERAMRACDQIKQNAIIFLESPEGSQNFSAGRLMVHLAEEFRMLIHTHYKSHHIVKPGESRLLKHQEKLIEKANRIIEASLAKEEALKIPENIGEKIKNYILNILVLVFTLGVLPLTRKFVLKKPAFFSSLRNEVAEEARLTLLRVN